MKASELLAEFIDEVKGMIARVEREFPDRIHYFTTPCWMHAMLTYVLKRMEERYKLARSREEKWHEKQGFNSDWSQP